jgi:hypothetical protein
MLLRCFSDDALRLDIGVYGLLVEGE